MCGTVVSTPRWHGDCRRRLRGRTSRSHARAAFGGLLPVGTTTSLHATDGAAIPAGTQTVTVIDNTPPVVTPPANIVASADANSCSASVNPGTATVTDNCSGSTVVGTRSDSQPLNAPYPVGTTTITWTGTDANGNTASASQTVTVQDNQPPSVASSVAVTTMGPPFNHAMINVGLSATASDSCPGLGPLQVSVYSDEDDGAAPPSPDALHLALARSAPQGARWQQRRTRLYRRGQGPDGEHTAVSCRQSRFLENTATPKTRFAAQATAPPILLGQQRARQRATSRSARKGAA